MTASLTVPGRYKGFSFGCWCRSRSVCWQAHGCCPSSIVERKHRMRRFLTFLLLSLPGCAYAAAPQTAVLDLKNMTCAMCSITVHKALEKVPGVIAAEVDYDHKTATVKYDRDKTSPAALVNATTNAGFPSTLHNG